MLNPDNVEVNAPDRIVRSLRPPGLDQSESTNRTLRKDMAHPHESGQSHRISDECWSSEISIGEGTTQDEKYTLPVTYLGAMV